MQTLAVYRYHPGVRATWQSPWRARYQSLPREDIFQPVKRKEVTELAGYDVGQKARSGKALFDHSFRLLYRVNRGVLAVRLATCTGILFAHMMQTLEVSGIILQLPALIGWLCSQPDPRTGSTVQCLKTGETDHDPDSRTDNKRRK